MCSHYQAIKGRERYLRHFGVEPPAELGKFDVWPGDAASFIRRHPQADAGNDAVPAREALSGLFGLVPRWSLDTRITGHTCNARSETVASKPSFRDAWKQAQHCIVPAEAIYEPDWRSGVPIPTRIARADAAPMGIAGLWSCWKSPQGELVHSFTLLTINAAAHPLMRHFHKPTDEKRMVVVLPEDQYDHWLQARPEQSMALLRHCPAPPLRAAPASASHAAHLS